MLNRNENRNETPFRNERVNTVKILSTLSIPGSDPSASAQYFECGRGQGQSQPEAVYWLRRELESQKNKQKLV